MSDLAATIAHVLGDVDGHALAVNVPYVVAFAAVCAEVAHRALASPADRAARRALARRARTAATMAAGAIVVGIAYTAVFRSLWSITAAFRLEPLTAFWADHPALAFAATFVAWDASGFVYHVVGHRTALGWAAHQAHHSDDDYDLLVGLRQSWTPFHGLLHHPLLALAGFDIGTVFVCAALSNCWQVLEHTRLDVRLPRFLEAHVMSPTAHRHHHGRGGAGVNLGPFFTWWDRALGTWVAPDQPAPAAYGPPQPIPGGAVAVELAGYRRLLVRRREGNCTPAVETPLPCDSADRCSVLPL